MNDLDVERQALREEVRRLELMNEAMVDAGKAVVAERDRLRGALRLIMDELGVPQPGYLQPVANAYEIAEAVLCENAEVTR